jgi:hypothetical protein
MGWHDRAALAHQDFGPTKILTICVLADAAKDLEVFATAEHEFSSHYGLHLSLRYLGPWRRPGWTGPAIYEGLLRVDRPAGCHKLFALVRRSVGDYVWTYAGMPTIYGIAGGITEYDRAFAVLDAPSVLHEMYHLLGCTEHFDMQGCYPAIAELKRRLP